MGYTDLIAALDARSSEFSASASPDRWDAAQADADREADRAARRAKRDRDSYERRVAARRADGR